MKFAQGTWVEVTVRRLEGHDLVLRGKVVEATRDYAVAECRTADGPKRFTYSEDTIASGYVSFRRLNGSDFRRRRAA